MPIYEYECKECRHKYEVLQMTKENEGDLRCPQCGALNVVKLLSAFSPGSNSGNTKTDSCSSGSFT
jgi:putative FmdB family regulatory protein